MAGIQGNIEAVAAGKEAVNIVTSETVFTAALITMGGMGATLPLNVMMMFSKAKKLKVMGRICIGPSIFNINEPLVFGAPIAFNPIMMVPFWLNSIAGPVIIWFSMRLDLLYGAFGIRCTGEAGPRRSFRGFPSRAIWNGG